MTTVMIPLYFALVLWSQPPILSADKNAIDLGEVRTGTPLAATVQLKNLATVLLQLHPPKLPCGCIQPIFSKDLVEPGKTTPFQISIRTLGLAPGPRRWTIQIPAQAGPIESTLEVTLSARLIREIDVSPTQIAVHFSDSTTGTIVITDARAKPLNITGITAPTYLKTTHIGRKITWHTSPDLKEGQQTGSIEIQTDDPAYPQLSIPVALHKGSRPPFRIAPEELVLRTQSGIVAIMPAEGRTVQVQSVVCDPPCFDIKTAHGNQSAAIRLTRTDNTPPSGKATLTITLQDPLPTTVSVPIRWDKP
jgi:hypothetical protein